MESLRLLQSKIDEAQRKKNLLVARASAPRLRKDTIHHFERFWQYQRIRSLRSHGAKVDELEPKPLRPLNWKTSHEIPAWEAQFKELESSPSSADALLAELKSENAYRRLRRKRW
jgi:phage shock protein A